jgi:phosphomannomutase
MRACAQAIRDSGFGVENSGQIPTPALIAHAVASRRAGVMVSGSHIPFDRNGIKLNRSTGEVLKSDEPEILREVERVRAEEYGRTFATSLFYASGMLKQAPELPPVKRAAEDAYADRYLRCFPAAGLSGLRVLVYQHSAVGRDALPRILRGLGAEVIAAGRSDTFVPIDTENITEDELERLKTFAVGVNAGPLDAIVSTDGDSDRPLVIAVAPVDDTLAGGRRVRFLPGDLLGIVVAEYLQADAVAVPISANDAVERRMSERGVVLAKTKIGSPYVVSALDELRRDGSRKRIVGWEANGGFLTGSDIRLAAGTLAALPTRDATLPIIANLLAAAEQRVGLAALWDRLPARFGRAGLIDNFPVEASQTILARLIPAGDVIEVEFADGGRVLDHSRPAVSPSILNDAASAMWQRSKTMLTHFFTSGLGFDEIARINVLDGVRVYFINGDVAHIRPSGNAPQLRIYANSGTQARADQIVEIALREPNGILRQLERAFT